MHRPCKVWSQSTRAKSSHFKKLPLRRARGLSRADFSSAQAEPAPYIMAAALPELPVHLLA